MATVTRNFNNTDLENAINANSSQNSETAETYSQIESTQNELPETNSDYFTIVENNEEDLEEYIEINPGNIEDQTTTEIRVDSMINAPAGVTRGSFTDNSLTSLASSHPIITGAIVLTTLAVATVSIVSAIKVANREKRIAKLETKISANSNKYRTIKKLDHLQQKAIFGEEQLSDNEQKKLEKYSKKIEKNNLKKQEKLALIKKHAKLLKRAVGRNPQYYTNSPANNYSKKSLKAHQKGVLLAVKSEQKHNEKYLKNLKDEEFNLSSDAPGLYYPTENKISSKNIPLYAHRSITAYEDLTKTFDAINNTYSYHDDNNPQIRICRIMLSNDKARTELECSFDNQYGYKVAKSLIIKKAAELAKEYPNLQISEFVQTKKKSKDKVTVGRELNINPILAPEDVTFFNQKVVEANKIIKKFNEYNNAKTF